MNELQSLFIYCGGGGGVSLSLVGNRQSFPYQKPGVDKDWVNFACRGAGRAHKKVPAPGAHRSGRKELLNPEGNVLANKMLHRVAGRILGLTVTNYLRYWPRSCWGLLNFACPRNRRPHPPPQKKREEERFPVGFP